MIFLAVLMLAYLVVRLGPGRRFAEPDRWRLAFAVAMVVAGISHLANPTPFIQHLPEWAPNPELLVLVSGLAEIALGGGLFLRQPHRSTMGLALAVFLVAVFPANVYVAVTGVAVDGQPGGVYPWVRLPFQLLFVWLALWSTRAPASAAESAGPVHGRLPAV